MKLYFLLLFSVIATFAHSQALVDNFEVSDKLSWVTFGVGTNVIGGTSGAFDYTVQKKNNIFSGRLHAGSGGDSFASASFHYGLATRKMNGHYSATIGLAMTAGGNGTGGRYTGAGFAFGAQAFLKFGSIGLGVYAIGNINSYQSNLSIMVAMQFGSLR